MRNRAAKTRAVLRWFQRVGFYFSMENIARAAGLTVILGHDNLNTTARYTKRTEQQLGEAAERLNY